MIRPDCETRRLAGPFTADLALSLLLLPGVACAELSNDSLLGPGLRSRPAYDGSTSQLTEWVPAVRYLGDPWFVRSTQGMLEGGLRMAFAPGLHGGLQLAYEPGRQTGEAGFLERHRVPDLQRGASLGLQAEWDQTLGPVPVTVLARARRHTVAELGAQLDLRLSAGVLKSGPASAGVFTQATWADATSTRARYALTQQQSTSTGLPAFDPGSGLLMAGAGLLGSIDLSRHWVVVGSLEARRLQGGAARSPLVERASNRYLSLGLAYRKGTSEGNRR